MFYRGVVEKLDSGYLIGNQVSEPWVRIGLMASFSTFSSIGAFPFLGQSGFSGFRFVAGDGGLKYGWVRVGVSALARRATIRGFAHQVAPDTPIQAGEVGIQPPEIVLDGSVNQTAFPPEGGTLIFTGTVTNTTDEPQPLDLWVVARRQTGKLIGDRRLGTGTLAPGATTSFSASVPVPAGELGVSPEVKFHIGRYPRVFDSEAFTITREGPRGPANIEGDVPLFQDAEPLHVLFGTSEAPEERLATLPRTHGFSAPMPNPTATRTAFTLEVTEAQAVTVAAYNALGRRVALIHEGPLAAGQEHRLVFDGSDLPAGVYAVRAVGEAFSETRVITLTR